MKIKVKSRHLVIVAAAAVIITYLITNHPSDEERRYRYELKGALPTNAEKVALAERLRASAVLLSIKYKLPEETVFRMLTEYRSEPFFTKGSAVVRERVKKYSEEYGLAPAVVAGIFYDIDIHSGWGR